jgi:cephalosporin hydroxylase
MPELKEIVEQAMSKVGEDKVGVEMTPEGMTTWGDHLAKIVGELRYSDEDKAKWAKLIKDFNALFYIMSVQTWNNTKWRGVRVLKPATDMWVYQELINEIKPDLIIETGSWNGGSGLYMRDVLDKVYPEGKIISIDITHDILHESVKEVPGLEFKLASSVDPETIVYLKAHIEAYKCQRVMVILDSNHEEEHVSKELDIYQHFVTVGSMLVVEDTSNHPGPLAAVDSWCLRQKGFKKSLMAEKFMLTFNRDGYWEKIA